MLLRFQSTSNPEKRARLHKVLRKVDKRKARQSHPDQPAAIPANHQSFKPNSPRKSTRRSLTVWRDVQGKSRFKTARERERFHDMLREELYRFMAPAYWPNRLPQYLENGTYDLGTVGLDHENKLISESRGMRNSHPIVESMFSELERDYKTGDRHMKALVRRLANVESATKAIRRNPTAVTPRLSQAFDTLQRSSPSRLRRYRLATSKFPRLRIRRANPVTAKAST